MIPEYERKEEKKKHPKLTLPRPLKEKPHDKNLQPRHRNHHRTDHHTEIKNPPLRTLHRAEIPILPRPEILLIPRYGRQIPGDLHDALLQLRRLFRGSPLLGGQESVVRFTFHGDLEVDEFLGGGPAVVVEAEFVFAGFARREDRVELPLLGVFHDGFGGGAGDGVVDVEGAAGLDLCWGGGTVSAGLEVMGEGRLGLWRGKIQGGEGERSGDDQGASQLHWEMVLGLEGTRTAK